MLKDDRTLREFDRVTRDSMGNFSVLLPSEWLQAGTYQIQVFHRTAAADPELVGRYGFVLY